MKLLNRISKYFTSEPTTKTNRFRPEMETLGERIVPANKVWNPIGASVDGSAGANWGGTAPANGDNLYIQAGRNSLNMFFTGWTDFAGIYMDQGYTGTFSTPGNITVSDGWVRDGTLDLNGTFTLDGNFTFGHSTGGTYEPSVLGGNSIVAASGSSVTVDRLNLFGANTGLVVNSGGQATIKILDLAGSSTVNISGNVTLLNQSNISAPNPSSATNNVIDIQYGGTLSVAAAASAATDAVINNYGSLYVPGGSYLYVNSSLSGDTYSLYSDGYMELETSGTISVVGDVIVDTGGQLNIERSGAASGVATATLTTPNLILVGSNLCFESNVVAGSRTGENILAVSGDVYFENGSNLYMTFDGNNVCADQLTCDEVYTRGAGGTATSTITLNTVGTVPGMFSVELITVGTGHYNNFNTYTGFGSIPVYGWTGIYLLIRDS